MNQAFYGILYRMDWALQEFNKLDNYIRAFFNSDHNFVRREYDLKGRKYVFRTQDLVQVDPIAALTVSNIVHNLRSSLDNLAWALALTHTSRPHDRTAFPIHLQGRGNREYRDRSGKTRKKPIFHAMDPGCGLLQLRSVSGRHVKMIEGVQPYKRGNGSKSDPLWLLHELNTEVVNLFETVLLIN